MRVLLSILCLWVVCAPTSAAESRPNFVIFLSDDHGQLDGNPYGAQDVRTPSMQRLAEAGMTFDHAYIASPACAPSRAAMLTGLMPARNGAEANHSYAREDMTSLPKVLQSLGYQTAAFGKVAHGKSDVARHGFDVHDARHDAERVREYLNSIDADRPVCLFVGTHEPHVPWPDRHGYEPDLVSLPPTFIDTPETRDFRTRYYTDVTKADTLLGEVLDLAREHLDPRQTLTVYTSDHGAQWPFGKWNLYDAGIRVPFIAAWPGVITPGSRSDAMIQWIDLLPTLIDAAGGEVPPGIDGRSFLDVLEGPAATHREVIFTTHSGDGGMNVYPIRSIRTADWKLILNLHPEFAHTTHIDKALARDGGRYWISWYEKAQGDAEAASTVRRYHQRPRLELYDLSQDPFEQHNLADIPNQAARVQSLLAQLEAWMQDQGDERTVFHEPRLLSEPASTRPGEDADTDVPRNPRRGK